MKAGHGPPFSFLDPSFRSLESAFGGQCRAGRPLSSWDPPRTGVSAAVQVAGTDRGTVLACKCVLHLFSSEFLLGATMEDWPTSLEERDGEAMGFAGITIFHDFPWTDLFPEGAAEFSGGQDLFELVQRSCPDSKTPALLLTRQPDARQGHVSDEQYFVLAVNIDAYIRNAEAGVAASYLNRVAGMNPDNLTQYDWSQISDDHFRSALDQRLNPDLLRHWIRADPDRLQSVIEALGDVTGVSSEMLRGREQETAEVLVALLQDDVWSTLQNAGAEIPVAMAQHRIWKMRKAAVSEFELHMADHDWTEPDWQKFFTQNTWIFGFGLRYQFLHQIAERPYTGGKDYTGRGGQESDYLFATGAEKRFTVLVDIKRPDADLVLDKVYRTRVPRLGKHLVGGVSQVQQQCWRWEIEGSRTDDNRELLETHSAHGHRPAGILIVGDTRSLGTGEKLRTFESFRRSIDTPEVLTFDEMLERGKKFISLSEEQIETGR